MGRPTIITAQGVRGIKSPCRKDCPNRTANCHFEGNCKEYDDYRKAVNEFKKSGEYAKYMKNHGLGIDRRFY